MITIVVPVGPDLVHKRYFQELLESIKEQTVLPSEVLLVDDMANLEKTKLNYGDLPITIHKNPWLSGCAHSNNFGVALAKNELVMFIGSDDKFFPNAVEDCLRAWEKYRDPLGYYWCDVEYNDGEQQAAACGGAMVTKTLWQRCGGFPIEASVGACDSILISIMLVHSDAGHLIHVESERPPYWTRRHQESITAKSGPMQGPIFTVRTYLTGAWKRPTWTEKTNRIKVQV